MFVKEQLYQPIFCILLDKVVAKGIESLPVEKLKNRHFHQLSHKINMASNSGNKLAPNTFRDYRYIYLGTKSFSVREDRLDVLSNYIGFDSWLSFKQLYGDFQGFRDSPKSSGIRLLILPDIRVGLFNAFEGRISDLIKSRYEELRADYHIDNLELLTYDPSKRPPNSEEAIREVGKSLNADLVIKTNFLLAKELELRISYQLVEPEKWGIRSTRGASDYQVIERLSTIFEGDLLKELDTLLLYMSGMGALDAGKQETAKRHLMIALSIDNDYAAAHALLGEIYLNEGLDSEARNHFKMAMNCSYPGEDAFERSTRNFISINREMDLDEFIRNLKPMIDSMVNDEDTRQFIRQIFLSRHSENKAASVTSKQSNPETTVVNEWSANQLFFEEESEMKQAVGY